MEFLETKTSHCDIFDYKNFRYGGDHDHETYVKPNEYRPDVVENLLKKTNTGVYISVGSERSFIGASMANSEYLYLVDYDYIVNQYNMINIWLLQLAVNYTSYIHLRNAKTIETWKMVCSDKIIAITAKKNSLKAVKFLNFGKNIELLQIISNVKPI